MSERERERERKRERERERVSRGSVTFHVYAKKARRRIHMRFTPPTFFLLE